MEQQMRAPIFEDKVIDFIFELVKISEKNINKASLEKALDKLQSDT